MQRGTCWTISLYGANFGKYTDSRNGKRALYPDAAADYADALERVELENRLKVRYLRVSAVHRYAQ